MVRQKGYRMEWKMARRTAHPKVVKTAPSSAYPKASMKVARTVVRTAPSSAHPKASMTVEMMGALDLRPSSILSLPLVKN